MAPEVRIGPGCQPEAGACGKNAGPGLVWPRQPEDERRPDVPTPRRLAPRLAPRLASIAALLACAAAHAAPPTDAQIESALDAYAALTDEVNSFEEYEAAMAEFRTRHPEVLDLDELDARSIERLAPILTATEASARDVLARAARLETDDTLDGAVAMVNASYIYTYLERKLPEPDRLASIVGHPKIGEALSQGYAVGLFELLAFFGEFRPEGLEPVRDDVLALGDTLTPDAPVELALAGMDYLGAIDALLDDSDEDRATRETMRQRVAAMLRGVRSRIDGSTDPILAEMLDDAVLRTDGAFARGELIGHEAPALDFIWASDHEDIRGARSLADLKGKVVVLDFWHTECTVCIRTFPKIRALAAQYAEADVVILGVTSLRGRHGDPERGVIDTSGSPESEFALMRDYIGKVNITWPIVFTSQTLYNPEYGVESTPHIAIIDPDGVVRHRALHPDMPMGHKVELIDALLAEFGKPVPMAPGQTGDESGEEATDESGEQTGGAEAGDDHDHGEHDGHDHDD